MKCTWSTGQNSFPRSRLIIDIRKFLLFPRYVVSSLGKKRKMSATPQGQIKHVSSNRRSFRTIRKAIFLSFLCSKIILIWLNTFWITAVVNVVVTVAFSIYRKVRYKESQGGQKIIFTKKQQALIHNSFFLSKECTNGYKISKNCCSKSKCLRKEVALDNKDYDEVSCESNLRYILGF